MTEQAKAPTTISCDRVSMAYVPGVWVLRDVTMALEPGTVTAVVGENGAGKSTLYRILAGVLAPSRGSIAVQGRTYSRLTPELAKKLGIAYVTQELTMCPDLAVYQNMFLGDERAGRLGVTDRGAMVSACRDRLKEFGAPIDATVTVRHLGVAEQQIVEILKSLRGVPRVWILDEPTSALGDAERDRLFSLIQDMKDKGAAVVYTTHRIDEIRLIADRVLVLRDGRVVLDRSAADVQEADMVEAMLGRRTEAMYPELPVVEPDAPVALEVVGLRVKGLSGEFSLRVRRGEVVGIAGLVGAGRSELLEGIYGGRRSVGTVRVGGVAVRRDKPAESIKHGLVLVPEDRKGAGLVLDLSVVDNVTLPQLSTFGRFVRDDRQRQQMTRSVAEQSLLRYRSVWQRVGSLSGGNQQKVLFGRGLVGSVGAMLLDEPTRGVDVGARAELYQVLAHLVSSGLGVLMVSSELEEVSNLPHRVLVMRKGHLAGEVRPRESGATERILRLALGYGNAGGPGHADGPRASLTGEGDRNDGPVPARRT
jgi:ribose transport system ATP-binding protein